MEEKKVTKISLSTYLLVIAILEIVVMGVFIYKLKNDKNTEIKKSANLQAQVNSLTGTVSDLKGKINKVSETVNSSSSVSDTNNTSNNTTSSFTDEQVNSSLTNYLTLQAHAGCDALLENLTEKGKLNYDSSKDHILNDGTVITTIKFSDYKNAMLNFVSESEFDKNWTNKQYFSENSYGYLTKVQGGGDLRVYTIKNISKTNDTTYSAKVSSVVDNNEYYEENSCTFTIKSYNGKCVIDSITMK